MSEKETEYKVGGEMPVSVELLAPEASRMTEMLAAVEKSSIDIQVATAHRFPRSLDLFFKRAMDMVGRDEETAQSCLYRRPVGQEEGGKMKYAEGKSVRLAEIVSSAYGNIRVAARVVEITERYVRAQGVAHDMENNVYAATEVVESTVTSKGKPMSERMRLVTAKAAQSKARRDATFQVVPQALCRKLEEKAREVALGGKTLEQRREALLQWINLLGIEPKRVWTALGLMGIEDVGAEELETLTGLRTSIKEGDVTVDEAFPPADTPITRAKATRTADVQARLSKAEAQAAASKRVAADAERVLDRVEHPTLPAEPDKSTGHGSLALK